MFFIQPDPIPAHRLAENLSVCRKKKRKAEDRVAGFECITFNLFDVDLEREEIERGMGGGGGKSVGKPPASSQGRADPANVRRP